MGQRECVAICPRRHKMGSARPDAYCITLFDAVFLSATAAIVDASSLNTQMCPTAPHQSSMSLHDAGKNSRRPRIELVVKYKDHVSICGMTVDHVQNQSVQPRKHLKRPHIAALYALPTGFSRCTLDASHGRDTRGRPPPQPALYCGSHFVEYKSWAIRNDTAGNTSTCRRHRSKGPAPSSPKGFVIKAQGIALGRGHPTS